jgi:HSP20 family protein
MALVRWRPRREWDPFTDFWDLRDEINQLFNHALTRTTPTHAEVLWSPPVDLYVKEGNVVVTADLPGLSKDEIDISVQNGVLTIKGQKKREKEIKEENYYCVERSYGSFQRSIELPTDVDGSKVKATYKDGVLEVVLPQVESAKPKKIKVDVQ